MRVTGRRAPREGIMFSSSDTASSLSFLRIVDLIPGSDSREVDQNSEPSIAVNPVDPRQMFAGAFVFDATGQPFFVSTDGGGTWSIFGTLDHHDKSIAWKADGSAVLVASLFDDTTTNSDIINTHSATVTDSGFASPIQQYVGSGDNDQPWIRGWSSNDTYPRALADVSGDGMADIVGFSSAGVYESLATGGGQFAMPTFELAAFGVDAGGWSSNDTYPRTLADVNGDTRADIIAFSAAGVYESLATAGGHFAMPTFELAAFGTDAGGWSSDDTYPRELADVNLDGRADIIGFGAAGVYESLATTGGHFAMPTFELAAFGTIAGGWSSDNTYPRALADVNGDGRADIVGFGAAGVYESLATGGGHFA
jgi:hypothetical protein